MEDIFRAKLDALQSRRAVGNKIIECTKEFDKIFTKWIRQLDENDEDGLLDLATGVQDWRDLVQGLDPDAISSAQMFNIFTTLRTIQNYQVLKLLHPLR